MNKKLAVAEDTFKSFRRPSNKLDFVFVTFVSQAKRNVFF